jgi:hypothetical protein
VEKSVTGSIQEMLDTVEAVVFSRGGLPGQTSAAVLLEEMAELLDRLEIGALLPC